MNRQSYLAILGSFLALLTAPALAHDKITTVLGGGPNGIPGIATDLPGTGRIAADTQGNLYIVDGIGAVFKLSTSGIVTHIAGNDAEQYDGSTGSALHIQLNKPSGIAVDTANPANVYIADTGNCLVRKLDQKTGLLSIVAGSIDSTGRPVCGFSGDGGPANAATLVAPVDLAINPANGDLYIADGWVIGSVPAPANVVRKVGGGSALGTISTVAGQDGKFCSNSTIVSGAVAISTPLCTLQGVALDTSASPPNLYIADGGGIEEVVGATSKMYRVAGNAAGAQNTFFSYQIDVAANHGSATVQVADALQGDVFRFSVTSSGGIPHSSGITVVAGSGKQCTGNTNQPLNFCMDALGIAQDASGDLFISDAVNDEVYKIAASTGQIATVIGWNQTSGNVHLFPYTNPLVLKNTRSQPALDKPVGVFADPASSKVYVAGGSSHAAYVWDSATNRISDFAGNGIQGLAGDGLPAIDPSTELANPSAIAKDPEGNIYIADPYNVNYESYSDTIRRVDAHTGIITTFAGGPNNFCVSDGCLAADFRFVYPASIAFNAAGDMYVADAGACAIFKIDAQTTAVTRIAGSPAADCAGAPNYANDDGGPALAAILCQPTGISVDGAGNIYFNDTCNSEVRMVQVKTGLIQAVAGVGGLFFGFNGDGPATQKQIAFPGALKVDKNGNVFFADTGNDLVRWVTPAGQMITFGGDPSEAAGQPFVVCGEGLLGDGGLATNATIDGPTGIDQDAYGNFYVVDQCNNRIRRISAFSGYGLDQSNLQFSNAQTVGTTSPTQTITLSAIGPTRIANLTLSDNFKETDNCTGETLSAGQTCQIKVTFQPTRAAYIAGFLRIYSDAFFGHKQFGTPAGNPDTVTLYGTGVR